MPQFHSHPAASAVRGLKSKLKKSSSTPSASSKQPKQPPLPSHGNVSAVSHRFEASTHISGRPQGWYLIAHAASYDLRRDSTGLFCQIAIPCSLLQSDLGSRWAVGLGPAAWKLFLVGLLLQLSLSLKLAACVCFNLWTPKIAGSVVDKMDGGWGW